MHLIFGDQVVEIKLFVAEWILFAINFNAIKKYRFFFKAHFSYSILLCFVIYKTFNKITRFWLNNNILRLSCVIVRVVLVVLRKTVGDNWRFDNLNGSHLQRLQQTNVHMVLCWLTTTIDIELNHSREKQYTCVCLKCLFASSIWRWLPFRLSKRQLPPTVLLKTTNNTRTITQLKRHLHLGSNLSLLLRM